MHPQYAFLKKHLPRDIFRPYLPRLIPIGLIWGTGVIGVALISALNLPWYANLGLALLIGYCWSLCGLLAHEVLHGSVVRNKKWQNVIGFFLFLPYLISPTFWRYWHNNLHHSHTQRILKDPDAYPTLKLFKQSRFARWMFPFTPGSGHKRSVFYFFFWFFVNTQVVQFHFRFKNKIFNKLNQKQVTFELALALALHIAGFVLVAPQNWLWAVFIPFAFMNYLPFSYISTNHNLSPLTKDNDPLLNSLTVTNHPVFEFLHINFGYHTEHHLFPTVSGVHLKKIHHLLKQEFPEKLQVMPKWQAIRMLYKTPRIYKDRNTLIHPITGETHPVIEPKGMESPL